MGVCCGAAGSADCGDVSCFVSGLTCASSGTGSMILGNGIVNSGFFLRIIIAVVAIYNGIADNINNPNTNPGNPYNLECASRIQSVPENISKLNIKCKIAHITKI